MTDENVVEIDRLRLRKSQHEKAAARAIEIHDGGTVFDEAIKKTVKEQRLDAVGEAFIRAKLIDHNTDRALEQVKKKRAKNPKLDLNALFKDAAGLFERVKPQSVKNRYEAECARELVREFLKTNEGSTVAQVVQATALTEATVKACVDKKTVHWVGKRGPDWLLGLNAPAAQPTAGTSSAKDAVVAYLKENGNSFIHKVARALGMPEKKVKEQVDRETIFWIEKKDEQWVIGLEKKSTMPTVSDDGRTIIDYDPDSLPANIAAARQALARLPNLYVSGGRLCKLTVQGESVNLVPLTEATMLEALATVTRWRMWSIDRFTKERVATFGAPPRNIVSAVLDDPTNGGIAELLGISRLPVVRYKVDHTVPEVDIALTAGYVRTDPHTNMGYYVHAPKPWTLPPTMSEHLVTQHEAAEAYHALIDPLIDFPFEHPAVAKSVFVASLLTLILRPMILGAVPGLLIEAPAAGSGKGLFLDTINILALGKPASRIPIPMKTWIGKDGEKIEKVSDEELEKRLSGYAERGEILIPFDNCNSEIGSSSLESILTAVDEVDFRVLGKTNIHRVRWRSMVTFNGNNPELVGDMHRRLLRVRLVPYETNAALSKKVYKYGNDDDLRTHLFEKRRYYIEQALTMVKAYFDACTPSVYSDDDPPRVVHWNYPPFFPGAWGSYTAWTSLIPHIILFAGGENPLKGRPIKDAASLVSEVDENIRIICDAVELLVADTKHTPIVKLTSGVTGITISTLIQHLFELREMDDRFNDARSVVKDMAGKPKRVTEDHVRRLNKALMKFDDKISNGRRFTVGRERHGRPALGFHRLNRPSVPPPPKHAEG
jgi:hypothetical protein